MSCTGYRPQHVDPSIPLSDKTTDGSLLQQVEQSELTHSATAGETVNRAEACADGRFKMQVYVAGTSGSPTLFRVCCNLQAYSGFTPCGGQQPRYATNQNHCLPSNVAYCSERVCIRRRRAYSHKLHPGTLVLSYTYLYQFSYRIKRTTFHPAPVKRPKCSGQSHWTIHFPSSAARASLALAWVRLP
jgi:hypothetical protein